MPSISSRLISPSPEMTAEPRRRDGTISPKATENKVPRSVTNSRNLLSAAARASLLPHSGRSEATLLRMPLLPMPYVGPCPKCGKDLQLRSSQKTRSMFIGCAGWPDCDVTYPLPEGQDRGTGREVPCLRHAADQGYGIPLEAARSVHRPRMRNKQRARFGSGHVPDV